MVLAQIHRVVAGARPLRPLQHQNKHFFLEICRPLVAEGLVKRTAAKDDVIHQIQAQLRAVDSVLPYHVIMCFEIAHPLGMHKTYDSIPKSCQYPQL